MTRSYARNEATYDRKLIDMMVAEGMATRFDGMPGYVIKTDTASYAVRDHQIIDVPADAFTILVNDEEYDDGAYEAEMAYERWLENGGPHAAAIQAEDEEERRREANDPWLQQLRAGGE